LSNRGAYHDFEYLVFGQARLPGSFDVLFGDPPRVASYLVDQPPHRLRKSAVVESGPAIS